MTPKRIAIAAGALLLAALIGYGIGRYATPAKVVTVTKVETKVDVQWRDRIVEKVVSGPVRTITHTVERLVPCTEGASTPTTDTTTTVEQGPVVIDRMANSDGTSESTTKTETKTVTVFSQPRLMLQAGGGMALSLKPTLSWSAAGLYRFAGPFWGGASYQQVGNIHIVEAKLALSF